MKSLCLIALVASAIMFLISFGISIDDKNGGARAIPPAIIFGAALIALAVSERKGVDAK